MKKIQITSGDFFGSHCTQTKLRPGLGAFYAICPGNGLSPFYSSSDLHRAILHNKFWTVQDHCNTCHKKWELLSVDNHWPCCILLIIGQRPDLILCTLTAFSLQYAVTCHPDINIIATADYIQDLQTTEKQVRCAFSSEICCQEIQSKYHKVSLYDVAIY